MQDCDRKKIMPLHSHPAFPTAKRSTKICTIKKLHFPAAGELSGGLHPSGVVYSPCYAEAGSNMSPNKEGLCLSIWAQT